MKLRSVLLTGAALGVAFTTTDAALAQGAPANPSAQVEEVVVTARKREESIQDVPVAVSAFTGEQLEQQGIKTPADLAKTVPSLSTGFSQNGASTVTFVLRGQSASDVILTIDQAIGLYADGGYIPRPYGLNAAMVDLQSVEVLKGPQGTLYGRNTTGGAINLISRSPDYAGLHGYVTGEVGNHESYKFTGAVNVPLIDDTLAARIAYQYWSREGYGSSRVTSQDLGGDHDDNYVRGSLRWNPTPYAQVDLKADYVRLRQNGLLGSVRAYIPQALTNQQAALELGLNPNVPANLITAQNALMAIAAQGNADLFTSDSSTIHREDIDHYSFNLTGTFDISDNAMFKSITTYRSLENTKQYDLDGTRFHILEIVTDVPNTVPVNYNLPQRPLVEDEFYSQEFNVSGSSFSDRLKWLVGAYYSNEIGYDTTQNDFRLNTTLFGGNTFLINFNQGRDIKNESWAFFTQNDFSITDQLSITAGLRYTEETRDMVAANRRFDPINNRWLCGVTGAPAGSRVDEADCFVPLPQDTSSGTSYLLSLNYKFNPDTLVYLRTARGFRGGGFQLRTPDLQNFQPEVAEDIEIGLKTDLFDRRLRANLAYYKTDYSNKQESQIIPLPPPRGNATIITNAAAATIQGFEAELFARPIEALTLRLAASWIDGKYDTYPGALRYAGGTPVDATGEKFAYPPWTVALGARYELAIGPGELALQADWSWRDGAQPTARLVDPALPASLTDELVALQSGAGGRASLSLLNLRADYQLPDNGLTFSLWATNALDEEYQIPGVAQPNLGGVFQAITGEPRMWGVSVRKSFGDE
jgi:iron complex outermembrane recepter protein